LRREIFYPPGGTEKSPSGPGGLVGVTSYDLSTHPPDDLDIFEREFERRASPQPPQIRRLSTKRRCQGIDRLALLTTECGHDKRVAYHQIYI
jgi:hypothetical protein